MRRHAVLVKPESAAPLAFASSSSSPTSPSPPPPPTMDNPSWTDTLRAALASCAPCFAFVPDADAPDSPPASYAIRRARADELEGLLSDAHADTAADVDAISLHSHLGPRGRRQLPPRTPKHISLFGYSLFGQRNAVQLPADADAPDPLHRAPPAPQRASSDSTTNLLFSADIDASAPELSAEHIDAEAARRARRRARKEMRRLATAVALDAGGEFEGFQGSGVGAPSPSQHRAIPAPFLVSLNDDDADEATADLDGGTYARLAPRTGAGGSRSSGLSRSSGRSSGSGGTPSPRARAFDGAGPWDDAPAKKSKKTKSSRKSKSSTTSSTLHSPPPSATTFGAPGVYDAEGEGEEFGPFAGAGSSEEMHADLASGFADTFGGAREALPSPGLSAGRGARWGGGAGFDTGKAGGGGGGAFLANA
ncbi:hypothetical protein B0H10DRAFT_2238143 [Mycena sp. CBHHK59/15]|nr:hypothetical protein B0H10DRAFT_2238143 [Mycena sp. CBHHK59/15]